ncbi:MAG: hypothetical protein ABII07_00120 [Patescibacteria group bacterium]|nr:hypothetical protein [Patescibacteria group bacterium]
MSEINSCPEDFMDGVEISTSASRYFLENLSRGMFGRVFDDRHKLALRNRVWEILSMNGGIEALCGDEVDEALSRFGKSLLQASGMNKLFLEFRVEENCNGDGVRKDVPISFSIKRAGNGGVNVDSELYPTYKLTPRDCVDMICIPSKRRVTI